MLSRNENTSVGSTQSTDENKKATPIRYLVSVVFILYALAVLYGVIKHEPWRDEAQAWLLVRDTSFSGLLKMLPSEGHPPLWYLLLMPVVKMGMPYMSMNILNGLIMIAAVYLLLFRTKMPLIIKLAIPFSYFLFYEYSFIARNYGLVFFFCMAIVSLYAKRFDKPILYSLCIAGLYNSHVLAFPLATGFLLLFAIEAFQQKLLKGKVLAGLLIAFVSGIYLIPYIALNKMNAGFAEQINNHQQHIADAITKGLLIDGNSSLAILLFAVITIMLVTRVKPLLLMIIGAGGILYILGYRYSGYLWHAGLLFIVIVTVYGVAAYYPSRKANKFDLLKYGGWVVAGVAVLQLSNTISSYKQDIDDAFSGAKDAAEFILDNHLEHQIIVGQQAWAVSAIGPYLPKDVKFYYSECQRYGTYYINDSCFFKEKWALPTDYAARIAYENFKDSLDKVILVLNYPVQPRTAQMLERIYQTDELPIRKDEGFFIYRFKKMEVAAK